VIVGVGDRGHVGVSLFIEPDRKEGLPLGFLYALRGAHLRASEPHVGQHEILAVEHAPIGSGAVPEVVPEEATDDPGLPFMSLEVKARELPRDAFDITFYLYTGHCDGRRFGPGRARRQDVR